MHIESKKFQSIKPGAPSSVDTRECGLEYALRSWKKILKDNNVVKNCYDKNYYVKPSDRRREMMNSAKYIQSKESMRDAGNSQ